MDSAIRNNESTSITLPVRRLPGGDADQLTEREWLVTNGLGGYSSGTVSGAVTRRYHGLLIAAHPAPLGRVMMLNHLREKFRYPDWSHVDIGGVEHVGSGLEVAGTETLVEFRLEYGLPVWRYESSGHVIEKRIVMPHGQNTVWITYRLVSGHGPVQLKLRPALHFRGHDDPVTAPPLGDYQLTCWSGHFEIAVDRSDFPQLRLKVHGIDPALTIRDEAIDNILYRIEAGRGYDDAGSLWSPGGFEVDLTQDTAVSLVASTEAWEQILALDGDSVWEHEIERRRQLLHQAGSIAQTALGADLILAADQFIITPAGRLEDEARARATGQEARTIIAGYHWFTDWGRDSMISLEGLTLITGRHQEAASILRIFATHMRDGLIPNYFPDHATEGVYHTADATLWFFHALSRYQQRTGDDRLVKSLLPQLKSCVEHHLRGTRFGIGMDSRDGLLRQGAEGYQLTWMDAKVGDWVVTPRRGKAVEINALWYNALRTLETWLTIVEDPWAETLRETADLVARSFNERFWVGETAGLYDVIDGPGGIDSACRPNQVFSISLDHPVLERHRWPAIVDLVAERLLTPVGLRTLAPGHPQYSARYSGDLRSRDAAYHQGTVWPWLMGPFVDAWRKTYPDRREECAAFVGGFQTHMNEACVGTISEIFDAESPYYPRGCAAQAWSVAELLRIVDALNMDQTPDDRVRHRGDGSPF